MTLHWLQHGDLGPARDHDSCCSLFPEHSTLAWLIPSRSGFSSNVLPPHPPLAIFSSLHLVNLNYVLVCLAFLKSKFSENRILPVFLTLYSQHLCGQNQKLEIWSYAGQFIKLLYIADFICRTEENSFTYCQNCDAIEVGKYFETNHRKSRISYFHPYLPFLQS